MITFVTYLLFASAITISSDVFAAQAVPVTVKDGESTLKGDLYLPDAPTGSLPLVVVVHEWWGKNEFPANRAQRITDELGYAALAVDLYGGAKSVSTPQEAQALAAQFTKQPMLGVNRLKKFIATAPAAAKKAPASLDLSKIAAIGYCFGGGQVLNLARANRLPKNQNLVGVVSFHGTLSSKLEAKTPIQPKLLVVHGDSDQMVKPQEVIEFKEEMQKANADLTFLSYPGASHAFTNPKATEVGKKYGIPIAYNAEADTKSWNEMATFLQRIFASRPISR
ncbi:MAG TPA: dienelactone hydrolase family protein [Bdellovibrionota bacterium]|nr:dienelactone hydrolase family protein [Bdellovibrionota bacterium]